MKDIRGKPQVLLITPEYRGLCTNSGLGEHVMQVNHLVLALVTYNDQEGAVIGGPPIVYQRFYPAVQLFSQWHPPFNPRQALNT